MPKQPPAAPTVELAAPDGIRKRMADANAKLGKARIGQRALRAKISELKIELEDDPRFRQILKLERKLKVLKAMEREAEVEMTVYSDEMLKGMGRRTADYFVELIADPTPKPKKQLKARS